MINLTSLNMAKDKWICCASSAIGIAFAFSLLFLLFGDFTTYSLNLFAWRARIRSCRFRTANLFKWGWMLFPVFHYCTPQFHFDAASASIHGNRNQNRLNLKYNEC